MKLLALAGCLGLSFGFAAPAGACPQSDRTETEAPRTAERDKAKDQDKAKPDKAAPDKAKAKDTARDKKTEKKPATTVAKG